MTYPTPEIATMKQDISGLIGDWGVSCTIKRKSSSTRNSAGQVSASFTTVGTETMWIQPIDETSLKRMGITDAGILDRSTHQAYERFSGAVTQNQDQLTAAGDTYAYDVLSSQLLSTHRILLLQQVKRT